MDNNELLMIVLAFVVGYMCSGMMRQMCGRRLVEGTFKSGWNSFWTNFKNNTKGPNYDKYNNDGGDIF